MSTPRHILCLNSGSSSLKFAHYRFDSAETHLASGAVEGIGQPTGRLWVRRGTGERVADATARFDDARAAVSAALEALRRLSLPAPDCAGHRLVHGGPDHVLPERVDADVLAALRALVPFAPLHLPAAIDEIAALAAHRPDLPQVVCFDTAFHRQMPDVARRLPLPRALWDAGIRRYGFHGLSYEYIVETAGAAALGRAVIAHLGNGASLAAVHNGQAIDTTMGLTPTGGVMMGTRSGDLDPGVLLHLMRVHGYDAEALERLVDWESGLLGVSGLSADMRTLLDARDGNPQAAEAVELFCYSIRKHIGQLAAALGGIDTLVFTGGIGERAAAVRLEVCRPLAYLGIQLDAERNRAGAPIISAPESPCTVRVIATDEDLMIARHTHRLLG
jgi:acetate kinase